MHSKGHTLGKMRKKRGLNRKDKKKNHKSSPIESKSMAEAVLLSVIQKLDKYREHENEETEMELSKLRKILKKKTVIEDDGTDEKMERIIKEMREIVDIMRDKKLGEGRRLKFLVSDLVHMADVALDNYKLSKMSALAFYKMESVQSWMGEIKKRMLKLGVDEAETTELRRSENDGEAEDDEYVVGLEKDVEKQLHSNIIGGSRDMLTFLIKGMCGIGKTTLARELYNHAEVVSRFQCRAWVCVSNDLTIKELLIRLIQQVAVGEDGENLHTSSLLEEMDNRSLLDMLHHHLHGMRYLIVLDDVPKEMALISFHESFPDEYNGSRLMLTSHMMLPIITSGVFQSVYSMGFLDSDKSLQLFLETISRGNKLESQHNFPINLRNKAKHMLISKCGGVPLAIKEVGKQLAEKKVSEGSEWEQLIESVDFGSTLDLLEPFYQKLDPKLESCFLYMALFKENTTLRAEKLKQIWAAGRVVVSQYSYESCLTELRNESVINFKDKTKEYCMNPLLHRLFIRKAEEKLEFEILSRSSGKSRPSQIDPRHRVMKCSREKFNYSTNQDNHLVSLTFHGGGHFDASPSYWKSFDKLKILDLEDFGLKILPESIGTLIELRYLGLRNNHIQELPHSLGCLENLEVLDIAQNIMVEVPNIIWEMGSLQHLYMSDIICRQPLKIDALWNLKTLTYISVDNWRYELSDLKMLPFLENLGIEKLDGNSDASNLFVSLADLKYLRHLTIRGYRYRSMPCLDEVSILPSLTKLKLDGLLARLPSSFPYWTYSLTLVNSCLDEDPMPILQKLPKLHYLKLRNAYSGQQMVISPNGFPNLDVLYLEELWNLRNVKVGKGAMAFVEELKIHNCPYFNSHSEAILRFYIRRR